MNLGSAKSEWLCQLCGSPENNSLVRAGNRGGGGHIDVLTGSLTHRFFGVRKVDPPKLALATGIGRFRDPFFGSKKVAFLRKNANSGHETFTFGKGCKNHTLLN